MATVDFNARLLRALRREPVDSIPIWMMRQAGRYLPEYRQLRKGFPHFIDFCLNHDAVVEATCQPLARFDLDAAILFSDILLLPHSMGIPVVFDAGHGPRFDQPIRALEDLSRLHEPDAAQLDIVARSISSIRSELSSQQALIGFVGAPWTVAAYVVEGSASRHFRQLRMMTHAAPEVLEKLLAQLTFYSITYLRNQIIAGADAVMLFDSWAALLNPHDYQHFSLAYVKQIITALRADPLTAECPIIYFAKGVDPYLEKMLSAGMDALGLDWNSSIKNVRSRLGQSITLQGNLDPAVLFDSPKVIDQVVTQLVDEIGMQPGHIFNLGHGIDRQTPIDHVSAMIASARCAYASLQQKRDIIL